jgi:hypothetical protein
VQRQPPRLVLRYALFAGIALVVAVASGLLLARQNANARAEHRVLDAANAVADRLGHDDLSRTVFQWPPLRGDEDERPFLADILELELLGSDVRRVTLFSPDGHITYSSDRKLVGTLAPDQDKVRQALRHATVAGTTQIGETKVVESYVPVHWAIAPKSPRGVLAVARDYGPVADELRSDFLVQAGAITLALLLLYFALLPIMRRITRSLRQSEANYRALMDESSDGILVFDEHGALLQMNKKLCELTGYSAAELATMKLEDLFDPDDLEELPLRVGELLAGRTVLQERDVRRRDGTVFVAELHGSMLEDGRLQASFRDRTERRHIEQQLRDAHRAEALGRMASGVADDFGVVLARVADALAREDLDEAIAATGRGTSLVRQLQAFAEKPAPSAELLDLNDLLTRAAVRLQQELGSRVELRLQPGDGLHAVRADPVQIEQVMLDLALNARESMPGGGTLTIATANVDFSRRKNGRSADGSAAEDGHFAMLAVSDTAAVAEGGELMGLGLATVFAIVQQSGGTIGVESKPGTGTTVRVYLPRAELTAPTALRTGTAAAASV